MPKRTFHAAIALIILVTLTLGATWPVVAQGSEPPRAAPGQVPLPDSASSSLASSGYRAGEVLVKFKAGASVDSALEQYGATRLETLYGMDVELWQVPQGQELDIVASLSQDPSVEYAEPNYLYRAFDTTPNDPYFSNQWAHGIMQSPAAWDVTTGSTGVIIAIIDSGIDLGHPDLAGKLVGGYDYVGLDAVPADENGHGTHVAGIAAAITNNGTGVAGMDWNARIMPIRVLNDEGSGSSVNIANGIVWAYTHGAKVINLSLGGPYYSQTVQDVIDNAHAAGSLIVAAMGNNNSGTPMYPAALGNVMAVAATGPTDVKASYSNYGSHCDIAAPGGDMQYYYDPDGIYSTMPTYPVWLTTQEYFLNNYDYLHGTSQAAPYVAGLAALIWSLDPGLAPDQIQGAIQSMAVDLGSAGWDVYYGYGRINPAAALAPYAVPDTPVLDEIDNPDGDGNYVVNWNDVPDASSYTLQEDDNPGFTSPVTRYAGVASQYSVVGQAAGYWYYRVRASSAVADSGWSVPRSVTVKPAPPVLDPIANPSDEDEYLVSWSASASASEYTLQEDDNAGFSSPTTRYAGKALEYQVTGQPGGTWYYRVNSSNGAGNSAWSNVVSTDVDPAALPAPALSPISNADGDGDYLVDWSDVAGATNYRLEESRDPYFANVVEIYSGAASQFSVTDQAGGHWYYRVRAFGPSGKSPWSNQRSTIVTTRIFVPALYRNYGGSPPTGLPIQQGFEGAVMPPSGWQQIVNNTNYVTSTWSIASYKPYSGLYQASVFWDPDLSPQNEVLLSPQFQASSAQLEFYSFGNLYWCRDTFDNCDLNVWLVVGAWGGGDDTKIYVADQDWVVTWQWARSAVNLTPYLPAGTPVRVGFQYEGLDGAQIALDAIQITP